MFSENVKFPHFRIRNGYGDRVSFNVVISLNNLYFLVNWL